MFAEIIMNSAYQTLQIEIICFAFHSCHKKQAKHYVM